MTNVITLLKRIGCKVVSRETTAGAQKWWLSYPPAASIPTSREAVLTAACLDRGSYYDGDYLGRGFELSFQSEIYDGHCGIFIAKPRKTKAGREWSSGIDC